LPCASSRCCAPGRRALFSADDDAESLWKEHRETTRGRDLDIGGLSWATLERDGPQQWPYVDGPKKRLYQDRQFATSSGRARFVASPYRPTAERASVAFPFQLGSSRLRDQWHGMSRSGAVPALFAHDNQPALRLHPGDAARRRLAEGELVRVSTARGALVLPLRLDARLAPGGADLPMHWGPEFVREGVNLLASRARCPDSQQPELKFSAAQVESADLPWRVSGCAYVPAAQGAALRQALQALMPQAGYAQCLAAPEPPAGQLGWALEAAFAEPPPAVWITELSAALALQAGAVHRYQDRGRGRLRLLRLQADGEALQALLRVGAHDEAAWLQALWLGQQPARLLGRWLLGPGNPPADALAPPPAPQVCLCFGVREDAIRGCLRRRRSGPSDPSKLAGLEGLQAELKCGTQCGSCLPTLRRIAKEVAQEGT
jgi:assimilatory nitrate reductase catalytic subunit